MTKRKLISICIPTYNRSSYVGRCIESVLGYQEDDIEVIVLDNCSTDNTVNVIAMYKDPRLKLLRNHENIGARRNIRKILDIATAEYCFFLTDDDMLVPGALHIVIEFIKKNTPSVFTSDLIVHLEKSRLASIASVLEVTKTYEQLSLTEKARIFIRSHILSGVCFRKDYFDFSFYDCNSDLWYPSMLIMGMLHQKMGYIAQPIVIHIWENDLFWDVNSGSDQLYSSYLDGVFALRDKLDEQLFIEICIQSAYNENRLDCRLKEVLSKERIKKIQRDLAKKKVKDKVKQFIKSVIRRL